MFNKLGNLYTYCAKMKRGYRFLVFKNIDNVFEYEKKYNLSLIPVKVVNNNIYDIVFKFKNGHERSPDIIDLYADDRI